jgi:hypothetical protein
MLGFGGLGAALEARPDEMVSVSPEIWDQLARALSGGALTLAFEAAFSNGHAFLVAREGLRGRRPLIIEWKGSHRAPGDEVTPVDLRIDRVFLVSCKYASRILINASPAHLFQRLLRGGHGVRGTDWFGEVAPDEYQALYDIVRRDLHLTGLPASVSDLGPAERRELKSALSQWPSADALDAYGVVAERAAVESALLWQNALASPTASEAMLWRLLRMGAAPYFVLGSGSQGTLRLRIATPWDWRQHYRLIRLDVTPQPGGQCRVEWRARVEDRHSAEPIDVAGHVEVRWSHGRFSSPPEAKVYLDTPHGQVPGYFPLH